jgi:hypothetical protein
VFQEKPLPGDFVIRRRFDLARGADVYVVTLWPDAGMVVAGPYGNYADALAQARLLQKDRYGYVWHDSAPLGEPERLEHVAGGERE